MKCFYDSFGGLLPCIAIARRQGDSGLEVEFRCTTNRGPYKRGERYWVKWTRIVPRANAYRSRQHCGQWRIINCPVDVFLGLPEPGIPMRNMRDFDKL